MRIGDGEGYHRSYSRPLRGRPWFRSRCLLVLVRRDRQRNRHGTIAEVALDFPFDVMRKLARAVFGEIEAIAGTQSANLAFVIRTLRRKPAAVIDEAVPHIDVSDAGLLGAAAVD